MYCSVIDEQRLRTIKYKALKFASFHFECKSRPGQSVSDMVLGNLVKSPEKRDELIKELNKVKNELAHLQVTKVMELAF